MQFEPASSFDHYCRTALLIDTAALFYAALELRTAALEMQL